VGEENLRQNVTTSITAKLFYLITTVVILTVVGMSIQSTTRFKRHLTQSVQDGLLSQAERASSEVSSSLEALSGKLSVIIPKIELNGENLNSKSAAMGLLNNDPEIVSASVFYSKGPSVRQIVGANSPFPKIDTPDNRYEGKSPDEVKLVTLHVARNFVETYSKYPSLGNVQVVSIAPETGLPLMLLTVRFNISGESNQNVYVSIAVWQTRMFVSLPKSKSTSSLIINESGDIFASSDTRELIKKVNIKKSSVVKSALSRFSPSGFDDLYVDRFGKERLGAYSQVAGYPDLFVIVERDANVAFAAVAKSYYTALLWAALFTLAAMLLSFIGAGSSTRSIKELLAVTKDIAAGNFSSRVQPRTKDEIAELGLSVNNMAGKITELMSSQVEKARFEKELETAKMVQSTFFPRQDINLGPLKVTGYYQPATECGGDLWGHYPVGASKQLVFIADAMGHGAPAALVTAIGYATCQAVATILIDEPHINHSPSKLIERTNKIIFDAVQGKISMTFFAALIDFKEGTITYANAGHNFPVILTDDKTDERIPKASKAKTFNSYAISLKQQGTPLGVDRNSVYEEKSMQIKAGDRIFLFTDGLIENQSALGETLGRKRLIELLQDNGAKSCHEIKSIALESATSIFGSTNLADDVTIVVAEISKKWSKDGDTSGEYANESPVWAS
jgi:serine phosphatase RsbU (regulator of sigma subunit)